MVRSAPFPDDLVQLLAAALGGYTAAPVPVVVAGWILRHSAPISKTRSS